MADDDETKIKVKYDKLDVGKEERESLFERLKRRTLTAVAIAQAVFGSKKNPVDMGVSKAPKKKLYDTSLYASLDPTPQDEKNDLFFDNFERRYPERDALRVGPRNLCEFCQRPTSEGENPRPDGFILLNKETGRGENYSLGIIGSINPRPTNYILLNDKMINQPLDTKGADRPNKGSEKFTSLESMLADADFDMISPDLRIAPDAANRVGDAGIIEYRTRDWSGLPQTWQSASTSQIVRTFEKYEMTPDLSARAVVGISLETPIGLEPYSNHIILKGAFLYDAKERYIGFAMRKMENLGTGDNNPFTKYLSNNTPLKK